VIGIRQSEFGAQNRSGVHRNLQFFARANIKCAGAVATNEDNSSEQVFGGRKQQQQQQRILLLASAFRIH
jgi:hypothetical protein